MYKFELTDLSGNPIADLPAKNRRYSNVLNNPGSISFDIDGKIQLPNGDYIASLIEEKRTEIHVYKGNRQMAAGKVRNVGIKANADSVDVAVAAVGFLGLLEERFLFEDKNYVTTDQGTICQNLIDYTNGRNSTGITYGTLTTGVTRTRGATEGLVIGKQILEAISQMSDNLDGFDYEVTPAKLFKIYYPAKGIYLNNHAFNFGKNIREIELQKDGSPGIHANVVMAMSDDSANPPVKITATVTDATSTGLYGYQEAVVSLSDIKTTSVLEEHADDHLAKYKLPLKTYRLSVYGSDPAIGSYEVGDWIKVNADAGALQIDNAWLRIIGIEVSLDENDVETINLTVADVNTLPKSIIDTYRDYERRIGALERR